MTGNADLAGPGGIEVTGLTSITHVTDDRKNRNGSQRKPK